MFRGLDVGSAKVGPEETASVRHHLLDVADIDGKENFSVADHCALAAKAIEVSGHGQVVKVYRGQWVWSPHPLSLLLSVN